MPVDEVEGAMPNWLASMARFWTDKGRQAAAVNLLASRDNRIDHSEPRCPDLKDESGTRGLHGWKTSDPACQTSPQYVQRWALATRKSRKACTRATERISAG